MPKRIHSRKVVGWRRKKLPDGRYLQIAITKEAGPKGGHTLAYVQTAKDGGKVYPAKVSGRKVRKRVGRKVKRRA